MGTLPLFKARTALDKTAEQLTADSLRLTASKNDERGMREAANG